MARRSVYAVVLIMMCTAFITLSGDGELIAVDWHEPGLRLNYQL